VFRGEKYICEFSKSEKEGKEDERRVSILLSLSLLLFLSIPLQTNEQILLMYRSSLRESYVETRYEREWRERNEPSEPAREVKTNRKRDERRAKSTKRNGVLRAARSQNRGR